MGLETLDVVQLHELALAALIPEEQPPVDGGGTITRAGDFLRQALTPLAAAARSALLADALRTPPAATPIPPLAELTAARKRLKRETLRRQTAEAALKDSQQHYEQLLAQSRQMQAQLRHLSHQILLAQEEERKQISRELHDEISQILTGINVRLAALKIEASTNTGNLNRKIVSTQRLVQRSVAAVHHFARELRPAMLDDLGLVPTLLAYAKDLGKRTGIQIRFVTSPAAQIEQLSSLQRTVLYRIAQEALTNVSKHARATLVRVSLQAEADAVCLEVADNGKSFDVTGSLSARRRKRLGIIGMRERAEMVGGTFTIESAPGVGTTVRTRVPYGNGIKGQT